MKKNIMQQTTFKPSGFKQPDGRQSGFTLIELMVTVFIVAILAAIAVPSYRQYVIKNAESETKAQMQQIQIDLEKWRASALTYQGFQPKKGLKADGNADYGYIDAAKKQVNIPLGSTGNNVRYVITLTDEQGKSLTDTGSTGTAWKMLATPNEKGSVSSGKILMTTSSGLRCQSLDRSVTISNVDCGTGSESW